MRVRESIKKQLLTHPEYRAEDTVELFIQARQYVKHRLQINSREMAVAVLLSRDESEEHYEKLEKNTWNLRAHAGM